MNRGYDQGLGLPKKYTRLFFVCTAFFQLQKNRCVGSGFPCEVPPGFEPGNKGFADLRLTTWLWHRKKMER